MILRLTVTLNNGEKHISEVDTDETDWVEIAARNDDFVVVAEINPDD